MNPNASSRPRMLCRSIRLWSSLLDREPSRHLATCADCRAFFAQNASLEQALQRDTLAATHFPPPTLEQGILAAVRHERAAKALATRSRPRWFNTLSVAGATAAVVLIAFVAESAWRARPTTPEVAPEEVAALVDSAASWTGQWWNSVVPTATSAIENNALQDEFASVYADAQSALDFLALNFLPSKPVAQAGRSPAKPLPTRTI